MNDKYFDYIIVVVVPLEYFLKPYAKTIFLRSNNFNCRQRIKKVMIEHGAIGKSQLGNLTQFFLKNGIEHNLVQTLHTSDLI